jgi:hypothetical protein
MSVSSSIQRGGRVPGNREVSRPAILASRGDAVGAGGRACPGKEDGSEPQASDAVEQT